MSTALRWGSILFKACQYGMLHWQVHNSMYDIIIRSCIFTVVWNCNGGISVHGATMPTGMHVVHTPYKILLATVMYMASLLVISGLQMHGSCS